MNLVSSSFLVAYPRMQKTRLWQIGATNVVSKLPGTGFARGATLVGCRSETDEEWPEKQYTRP
jgi:hypothetical protein